MIMHESGLTMPQIVAMVRFAKLTLNGVRTPFATFKYWPDFCRLHWPGAVVARCDVPVVVSSDVV